MCTVRSVILCKLFFARLWLKNTRYLERILTNCQFNEILQSKFTQSKICLQCLVFRRSKRNDLCSIVNIFKGKISGIGYFGIFEGLCITCTFRTFCQLYWNHQDNSFLNKKCYLRVVYKMAFFFCIFSKKYIYVLEKSAEWVKRCKRSDSW